MPYDAANQLTGISYSEDVAPSVAGNTYDGDDQRLTMNGGTGVQHLGQGLQLTRFRGHANETRS